MVEEISDTEEMLGESLDAEMAEMAKEELSALKKKKVELEDKIKFIVTRRSKRWQKHHHGKPWCSWWR